MPNMSLKKNEMPVQEPDVRNKNFQEVALGYTEEQAHKYIEKKSMDLRVSRRKVAVDILKTYEAN